MHNVILRPCKFPVISKSPTGHLQLLHYGYFVQERDMWLSRMKELLNIATCHVDLDSFTQ